MIGEAPTLNDNVNDDITEKSKNSKRLIELFKNS